MSLRPVRPTLAKHPAGRVFHTYSPYACGIDLLSTAYNYLDLVPKGRDEDGQGPSSGFIARTSGKWPSQRSTIARVDEFVPRDFDVPRRLETPQFMLEPLGPEHNDQDYDA